MLTIAALLCSAPPDGVERRSAHGITAEEAFSLVVPAPRVVPARRVAPPASTSGAERSVMLRTTPSTTTTTGRDGRVGREQTQQPQQ